MPPTAPSAPRGARFKTLRILILLLVLLTVAVSTCVDRYRSTRWREPLIVAIYPIAADSSPATRAPIAGLEAVNFKPIDRFFAREAARYRLGTATPVETRLRPQLGETPPQRAADAGVLDTIVWSLRLRYWAWRVGGRDADPADIRIFVLYQDPRLSPTAPHSLGLRKGQIGVVYAFAADWMNGANDVVIAHELLHTLGATDKYNAGDLSPRFPDGYGDPRQSPLFPQQKAELMAGRRMIAADKWEQADDLDEVVIGPATALEIRWPAAAR